MLHNSKALKLPPYSTLKPYEGQGNYAIGKYYKYPYRFFYRKKLKMIVNLMPQNKIYHNILDYGAGPGIFTEELKRHALFVKGFEPTDTFDTRWRYDAVVCASVLEFTTLGYVLPLIKNILNRKGVLYVGSPMDTSFSRIYYKLIKDYNNRQSHTRIVSELKKYFKIEEYKEWMNLYFALRATAL